jgi:outer membrane biosynthesis protein TonB
MKNIIRNLIIAAPLATAALTMVPAAAMASEPGPVIVVPPHTDPKPDLDIAIPKPKPPVEPKDKIALPKPKPPVEPKDKIKLPDPKPTPPKDKAPLPKPTPPQDKAPLPHGNDADDDSSDVVKDDKSVDEVVDTVELPNRVDAGLAADQQEEGGLDLAWLFAGGLAVTASGVAFAARRRTGSNA